MQCKRLGFLYTRGLPEKRFAGCLKYYLRIVVVLYSGAPNYMLIAPCNSLCAAALSTLAKLFPLCQRVYAI